MGEAFKRTDDVSQLFFADWFIAGDDTTVPDTTEVEGWNIDFSPTECGAIIIGRLMDTPRWRTEPWCVPLCLQGVLVRGPDQQVWELTGDSHQLSSGELYFEGRWPD